MAARATWLSQQQFVPLARDSSSDTRISGPLPVNYKVINWEGRVKA